MRPELNRDKTDYPLTNMDVGRRFAISCLAQLDLSKLDENSPPFVALNKGACLVQIDRYADGVYGYWSHNTEGEIEVCKDACTFADIIALISSIPEIRTVEIFTGWNRIEQLVYDSSCPQ
jgi:hypothetical protein